MSAKRIVKHLNSFAISILNSASIVLASLFKRITPSHVIFGMQINVDDHLHQLNSAMKYAYALGNHKK